MKKLVILRHAKAVLASEADDDHGRALTERGRADARNVAEQIVASGWRPDGVVVSDAVRTLQTWDSVNRTFGPQTPRVTAALYHAELGTILAEIGAEPASTGCLLVIGHNPGLEDSIRRLTARVAALPTAGAALLSFDGQAGWARAARSRRWSLNYLLEPR